MHPDKGEERRRRPSRILLVKKGLTRRRLLWVRLTQISIT